MASVSKSKQESATITEDNRIIADGGGIGINADGDVSLHMVPDEAFELAEFALGETTRAFSDALVRTQAAARTESAQLAEQIIKIGIPAAALVFLLARMK